MDRVIAAADSDHTPPTDVHELSRIQGLLRETTVGGCLLRDVINVARLGEPRPWSPPPLLSVRAGWPAEGNPTVPRPAWSRARPDPPGPIPAQPRLPPVAGAAPYARPHLARPIPFRAILPAAARTPIPALPPPPPAQALGVNDTASLAPC
jgi:hypothetical protein